MKIGVLGATSQIAKDLIVSFSAEEDKKLHLFARRPDEIAKWLKDVGFSEHYLVDDYLAFGTQEFDAILNFVGVGNPAQVNVMGASIFDVTLQYDELALNYLRQHPTCSYIFLSSGASYGSIFDEPVDSETKAIVSINSLQPQDWYGVAKLHSECRHRSLKHLKIVDIRVFNYFSHTQDIEARFFITDILRAIRDNAVLKISPDNIVRDFIGPDDFYQLVNAILNSPPTNDVIDAYSMLPISKIELLETMKKHFGLSYLMSDQNDSLNITGSKNHYHSLNKRAEMFGYVPTMTSVETILKEVKKFYQLRINEAIN
jgi:nucleoside-diphosphate-sugar epimerase